MKSINRSPMPGAKIPVYLFCLLLSFSISFQLSAQTRENVITGVVTDALGKALPNATIVVKGTNLRTVTDEKGAFKINKSKTGDILVVSYVGYVDKEVPATSNNMSITLIAGNNELNDIVVIGYGVAKKKDVVGSVNVINTKDAGATTATSPSQLIIGKAAGVQVLQSDGTPGANAQIIVRGTGSFTSVDPLYVIDGIQGDGNLFNTISPQDIENITILKDASSTAIYGSAAANGVVIINTKKAKSGVPKISLTTQWGQSSAWKQLNVLKAKDYIDLMKEVAAQANSPVPPKFNTPNVLVDSTDWQKAIFRNALSSENDININGGSEKALYNFSVGYITQQSIIKDLTNKRLNVRMSLDETLGRFRFGQSINIRYTSTTGQMAPIINAIGYAPYKPVYDKNIPGGYSIVSNVDDLSDVGNPLQGAGVNSPKNNEYVFYPQLFGEVNIVNGLKFRSQFSATIGGGRYTNYQIPYVASNNLAYDRKADMSYNNYNYYTLENYISFNRTFGKHNISATLGNSYIDAGNTANLSASGSGLSNDNIRNISVALNKTVTGAGYDYNGSLISYYGRLIYSFDNKYILTGSMRRDGASQFGKNNKYGNFPGVGLAWIFTEEDFAKNLPFINSGKLRAGWGRTGNNRIPNFKTSPVTYGGAPNGNLVYTFGSSETFAPGTTINSLANPDLRWEQTDQTDIGLDLQMLKNKLSVTIDWYNRKSSGLLVYVPIPASTGIGGIGNAGTNKLINAADAENKGIEVTIGYSDKISNKLSYNVSVNGAYNKNNVISLGSQFTAPIQDGSFNQLPAFTYTAPGSPIGSFYGWRVDHVARDQKEIDALNEYAAKKTGNTAAIYQDGLKPGDYIYKDINGNGTVTDSDRAILGSPIPKFVYGFNAGASYGNFDINIVVSGVSGTKIVNGMKYYTQFEANPHNATTDILDRWKKEGDIASVPKVNQNANGSGNLRPSDAWVESGDYFRLRNLTLGYSFSSATLRSVSGNAITRARVYLAAQNLFTITKYSGYDPEISTQGNGGNYITQRGIDLGQIPQPRTFLIGLQLGF